MSRRMFDESFRKMAVALSHTKGSVKEVADELGIRDTLLSKWRQRESGSSQGAATQSEDQKLIRKCVILLVLSRSNRESLSAVHYQSIVFDL
jgi:transposase